MNAALEDCHKDVMKSVSERRRLAFESIIEKYTSLSLNLPGPNVKSQDFYPTKQTKALQKLLEECSNTDSTVEAVNEIKSYCDAVFDYCRRKEESLVQNINQRGSCLCEAKEIETEKSGDAFSISDLYLLSDESTGYNQSRSKRTRTDFVLGNSCENFLANSRNVSAKDHALAYLENARQSLHLNGCSRAVPSISRTLSVLESNARNHFIEEQIDDYTAINEEKSKDTSESLFNMLENNKKKFNRLKVSVNDCCTRSVPNNISVNNDVLRKSILKNVIDTSSYDQSSPPVDVANVSRNDSDTLPTCFTQIPLENDRSTCMLCEEFDRCTINYLPNCAVVEKSSSPKSKERPSIDNQSLRRCRVIKENSTSVLGQKLVNEGSVHPCLSKVSINSSLNETSNESLRNNQNIQDDILKGNGSQLCIFAFADNYSSGIFPNRDFLKRSPFCRGKVSLHNINWDLYNSCINKTKVKIKQFEGLNFLDKSEGKCPNKFGISKISTNNFVRNLEHAICAEVSDLESESYLNDSAVLLENGVLRPKSNRQQSVESSNKFKANGGALSSSIPPFSHSNSQCCRKAHAECCFRVPSNVHQTNSQSQLACKSETSQVRIRGITKSCLSKAAHLSAQNNNAAGQATPNHSFRVASENKASVLPRVSQVNNVIDRSKKSAVDRSNPSINASKKSTVHKYASDFSDTSRSHRMITRQLKKLLNGKNFSVKTPVISTQAGSSFDINETIDTNEDISFLNSLNKLAAVNQRHFKQSRSQSFDLGSDSFETVRQVRRRDKYIKTRSSIRLQAKELDVKHLKVQENIRCATPVRLNKCHVILKSCDSRLVRAKNINSAEVVVNVSHTTSKGGRPKRHETKNQQSRSHNSSLLNDGPIINELNASPLSVNNVFNKDSCQQEEKINKEQRTNGTNFDNVANLSENSSGQRLNAEFENSHFRSEIAFSPNRMSASMQAQKKSLEVKVTGDEALPHLDALRKSRSPSSNLNMHENKCSTDDASKVSRISKKGSSTTRLRVLSLSPASSFDGIISQNTSKIDATSHDSGTTASSNSTQKRKFSFTFWGDDSDTDEFCYDSPSVDAPPPSTASLSTIKDLQSCLKNLSPSVEKGSFKTLKAMMFED